MLSGRLRVILAEHDLVLGPGEVAEFDTRLPHWFGSTGRARWRSSASSGARASGCTYVPALAHGARLRG